MEELTESITLYGVLVPGIVRLRESGGYELVAGHRRKRACELAGLEKMPVIIKDLTDDEATVIMVDSNIQREELLIERNSEFALEQVYNVIDSRYCKMLPLIVTTNLGLNEMKSTDLDTAHQRIYSRILEMCVPIYCGGEDKRKEEGTEKLVQVQNLITG